MPRKKIYNGFYCFIKVLSNFLTQFVKELGYNIILKYKHCSKMKIHHHHCGVLLLLFTAELVSTVLGDDICRATCTMSEDGNEECVFHSNVNLYAGELGYYAFEECGVEVNPTLGIELGKTYHFIQVKINVAHHILFFYHLFFLICIVPTV